MIGAILAIIGVVALVSRPIRQPRVATSDEECSTTTFYTIERDGYYTAPYIQGRCDHAAALNKWCETNSSKVCQQ